MFRFGNENIDHGGSTDSSVLSNAAADPTTLASSPCYFGKHQTQILDAGRTRGYTVVIYHVKQLILAENRNKNYSTYIKTDFALTLDVVQNIIQYWQKVHRLVPGDKESDSWRVFFRISKIKFSHSTRESFVYLLLREHELVQCSALNLATHLW